MQEGGTDTASAWCSPPLSRPRAPRGGARGRGGPGAVQSSIRETRGVVLLRILFVFVFRFVCFLFQRLFFVSCFFLCFCSFFVSALSPRIASRATEAAQRMASPPGCVNEYSPHILYLIPVSLLIRLLSLAPGDCHDPVQCQAREARGHGRARGHIVQMESGGAVRGSFSDESTKRV